jgi:hypothetical protein
MAAVLTPNRALIAFLLALGLMPLLAGSSR